MRLATVVGVILIAAGILALVLGDISYTKDETVVKIGPIEAEAKERETIPLPPALGVLSIVAGSALLVVGRRTRA